MHKTEAALPGILNFISHVPALYCPMNEVHGPHWPCEHIPQHIPQARHCHWFFLCWWVRGSVRGRTSLAALLNSALHLVSLRCSPAAGE